MGFEGGLSDDEDDGNVELYGLREIWPGRQCLLLLLLRLLGVETCVCIEGREDGDEDERYEKGYETKIKDQKR